MRSLAWLGIVALATACAPGVEDDVDDDLESLATTGIPAEGTPEARGVLRVANTLGWDALRNKAKISRNAARQILSWRGGPNAPIDTIAELDGIRWVGPVTIGKLLAYAESVGWVDHSIDFCGDGLDQDGDGADRTCAPAPAPPVDVHTVTARTTGSMSAVEIIGVDGGVLGLARGWREPRLRVINESAWTIDVRGTVGALLTPGSAGEWPTAAGSEYSIGPAGWGTPTFFDVVYVGDPVAPGPTVQLHGTAIDAHGRTLDALLELAPDVGEACGNAQAPMATIQGCVGYQSCWLNVRAGLVFSDPATHEEIQRVAFRPSTCDGSSPVSERSQLFWTAGRAESVTLGSSRSGAGEATDLSLLGDGSQLRGRLRLPAPVDLVFDWP